MNKRQEEKKAWLRGLVKHVEPGKIVEFGCGSGFVLEAVSNQFPDSIIVGMDKSMERLKEVVSKDLENVIPIQADITENIFPKATFDTALFVGSLHEVFSYLGEEKVMDAFRIAHGVLKDNGVLIVQDFLKPSPKSVELILKNEEIKRRFLRFADEFRPRKVRYQERNHGVKLDIADAVEFISKYHSPSEEDWKQEMNETHFFFAQGDYQKVAQQTGFVIKKSKRLPKDQYWWEEIEKDIQITFESEYRWIQLVLVKRVAEASCLGSKP